ncbi:response regulator [Rhodospirillum rubrum]|uniref:response regulator n=1 Tax=Rhodospirillum rubrum TaxID=1085 RepID=UPI0028AE7992|nr:response regulator [Rhodospirillum rubrum]
MTEEPATPGQGDLSLFNWSEERRLGVRLMDRDHQVVCHQAGLLAAGVDRGDGAAMAAGARFLQDYIPRMFEREDRLMANTNHPERGAHQDAHRQLLVGLMTRTSGPIETAASVLAAVETWIGGHIDAHDRPLARHVLEAAIDPFAATGGRRLLGSVQWDRLSVMVVDGQFAFRRTARDMLVALGVATVIEARDGVEALKQLPNHKIDALLVDLYMAPMDGVEFTHLMRNIADSPNPRALIILMTGAEVSQGLINRALDAGIHDLMKKPISQDALRARLERHLLAPLPFHEVGRYLLPVHPDRNATLLRRQAASLSR